METYIYKHLFNSYNLNIENREIWKNLERELTEEQTIDKLKDLDQFVTERLHIVIKKEMLDTKGYAKIENNKPVIYVELTNPVKINRFTIAHELAHIIYDYANLERGKLMFNDYEKNELFHDYSEVRANQFAAELLMPSEFVKKIVQDQFEKKRGSSTVLPTLTIKEVIPIIMMECEVSYTAAENRLKNLGMVSL